MKIVQGIIMLIFWVYKWIIIIIWKALKLLSKLLLMLLKSPFTIANYIKSNKSTKQTNSGNDKKVEKITNDDELLAEDSKK